MGHIAGRTDTQESYLHYMQPGRTPELEANLVVPLACGTMRDGIRADRNCNLYLLLCNERPRDGRAQQVNALVQRVCPGAAASMRGSMHASNVDVIFRPQSRCRCCVVIGLDPRHKYVACRSSAR